MANWTNKFLMVWDVVANVGYRATPGQVVASASAVELPFTPYDDIAAGNVQSAMEELADSRVDKAGDTMTGPLRVPAGSKSVPSLQVGDADTGLFQTSGKLQAALDGAEVWRATTTGIAIGATEIDPSEMLHIISPSSGVAARVLAEGDGAVQLVTYRHSSDNNAAGIQSRKSRGTRASPTAVAQNDQIFSFSAGAYDGATLRFPFELVSTVVAVTPSSTDMEARFEVQLAPAGSVTRSAVARFDHAAGISMFGANPVIDQNRLHRMRIYTVATLPSAGVAGRKAMVSDANAPTFLGTLTGGGSAYAPVFDDGTNWRAG